MRARVNSYVRAMLSPLQPPPPPPAVVLCFCGRYGQLSFELFLVHTRTLARELGILLLLLRLPDSHTHTKRPRCVRKEKAPTRTHTQN